MNYPNFNTSTSVLGWLNDPSDAPAFENSAVLAAVKNICKPFALLSGKRGLGVVADPNATLGSSNACQGALPMLAYCPALPIQNLGDPSFCAGHGLRFPYMTGSMANGISSIGMVEAMADAGMLGSFGAAGLKLDEVESAIDALQSRLREKTFCFNLIHTPNEPAFEEAVVDLYLRRSIKLIEASAYIDLTPAVVRYRVKDLHLDADGKIIAPNRIIAKVSRTEVAARWLSPPPENILADLVQRGKITRREADLAERIPMAEDLTAEADSGGHTDNRPLVTLLPTMIALRDKLQDRFNHANAPRVGAGGGIATPYSAAAAFAMGAAYLVSGSINQACVESGTCDEVRKMLAETTQADIAMAPAADMFEMGVKLQVIKRGTMFPMRAAKLYEIYCNYESIENIPIAQREMLEKSLFRESLDQIWIKTKKYFADFDPEQVRKAEQNPKHKMALTFRWYLGLSSRWANSGEPTRKIDYQIWCGPAMSAFNEWTKGTFLEDPANRKTATVSLNILYGAALATRINQLRIQGIRLQGLRAAPLARHELEVFLS